MGKNFTTAFAVCLLISSLPLACGDDEEPGDGGKGGKGGTSGSSGSSGASGSSGTGGTTGGTSGTGGTTGGTAGTAGTTGGTAGTAGTAGTDGGMGGADGGMGGEGGAPVMSVCERLCIDGQVASCSNQAACVGSCEDAYDYGGPSCVDEMDALWECAIAGPANGWSCDVNQQPAYDLNNCSDELDAVIAGGCA